MRFSIKRPLQLKWIIGAIILLLLLVTVIFWRLSVQAATTPFSSADAHVHLRYDSQLHAVPLGNQDTKDKVVLRLTEPHGRPGMLTTVRYEDGLKPIATATKQPLRDALATNITKTYPRRFPNFHHTSSRSFEIDGHEAYEQIFTYKNQDQPTVKQRFIAVVINDDKAAYLAFQTKSDDFNDVNKTYFDYIVDSVQIQ